MFARVSDTVCQADLSHDIQHALGETVMCEDYLSAFPGDSPNQCDTT